MADIASALRETRRSRTRRDYEHFLTNTIRVSVWFALCNLVIVGATTYFTWGHSRAGQLLIGAGAFVVGTTAAFILPLGLLWATAPTRQLRDARARVPDVRPPIRGTHEEAITRADARIKEGLVLLDRLAQADSPQEVVDAYTTIRAWEDSTLADLDAFSDTWAITFGSDAFEHIKPTDRDGIERALTLKIKNLYEVSDRKWIPPVRENERLPGDPVYALTDIFQAHLALERNQPPHFPSDSAWIWARDHDALVARTEAWLATYDPIELERYRANDPADDLPLQKNEHGRMRLRAMRLQGRTRTLRGIITRLEPEQESKP